MNKLQLSKTCTLELEMSEMGKENWERVKREQQFEMTSCYWLTKTVSSLQFEVHKDCQLCWGLLYLLHRNAKFIVREEQVHKVPTKWISFAIKNSDGETRKPAICDWRFGKDTSQDFNFEIKLLILKSVWSFFVAKYNKRQLFFKRSQALACTTGFFCVALGKLNEFCSLAQICSFYIFEVLHCSRTTNAKTQSLEKRWDVAEFCCSCK